MQIWQKKGAELTTFGQEQKGADLTEKGADLTNSQIAISITNGGCFK